MPDYVPTNAASSGVKLDKKTLKSIAARSDRPGLIYLTLWLGSLSMTGALVYLTLGTFWMWSAMFVHGIFLCVPTYSMSHETAHGTAFRTRWLNETVLWMSSLIYMEEPLHRRYTHTSHHTFTWWAEKDAQFPFDTPMGLKGWITEITGFGILRFHVHVFWQLATKQYTDMLRSCTPEPEFPRMTRNAQDYAGHLCGHRSGTFPWHLVACLAHCAAPDIGSASHAVVHTDPTCRVAGKFALYPGKHSVVSHQLSGEVSLHEHEQPRGTSPLP
jgi:fatty acid desaturase